jgi:enoyl-CoA hydratase/carnithine racemase
VGEIEISERSGGVRVVRLNRPDRLNALTPDMVRLITAAMEAGPDHRAIVITGTGAHPGSRAGRAGRPRAGRRPAGRRDGALSPFGQKMTKQVYRANADASSLEEALQLENRTQILANATADAAEARAAFLEKRRPDFTGR